MTLLYGTAVIAVILVVAIVALALAIGDIQRHHAKELARLTKELQDVRMSLHHHISAEIDDGK
jgi:hypothetical protein